MDKELVSKQDRCDWHLHVGTVRRAKESLVKMTYALVQIHDRQLWRAQYGSWDAFCAGELDFTRRRANQVIAGSKLVAALPNPDPPPKNEDDTQTEPVPSGNQVPTLPENERQARALARLGKDPEAQLEAFAETVELAGGVQPTVKQIREVIDARIGDTPLDGEGELVTIEALRGAFLARVKLKKATNHLEAAKSLVKAVIGTPGGEHIVPAETTIRIGATRERIAEHMPYLTCPDCEGVRPETCDRCTSRGWITKSET